MPSRRRTKIDPEQFAPDEDAFEFEEPAVPQVGLTAEEAAEEEAELEAGQYGIPSMAESVAKRVLPPRLTEEQDADFLKDLEDLPEAKAEVSREATFKGAGNYTYAKTADGDWFFTGPDGKTGVAKKGTPAFESIASEAAGKGSLWGTEGHAGPDTASPKGTMTALEGTALGEDVRSEILKLREGASELDDSKLHLQPDAPGDLITMTGTVKSQEGLDLLKERMEDLYGPQVDLSGVKIEGAADEDAPEEDAPEERAPKPPAPKNIKGDFSLDNPPPTFSPGKISTFLQQNPQMDPDGIRAFISNANYSDPAEAGAMFVQTIRAQEEMATLAKKGLFNRTNAEKLRYRNLRQALGVKADMTDRIVAATAALPLSGFTLGLGSLAAFAKPRAALGLLADETGIVASSPPSKAEKTRLGEDFGSLLEAELSD